MTGGKLSGDLGVELMGKIVAPDYKEGKAYFSFLYIFQTLSVMFSF